MSEAEDHRGTRACCCMIWGGHSRAWDAGGSVKPPFEGGDRGGSSWEVRMLLMGVFC